VSEAHIHRDTQRANNEAGRQKNKADCHSYFLTDPQPGEKGGDAGDGRKAGAVLGCDWPATPARWEAGRSGGTLHAPRPTQEKSIGQDEQDLQDFERSQKRIPSSSCPSC
jgi:hypothetical protein